MKTSFVVGDTVWDVAFGKGKVITDQPHAMYASDAHPIVVAFDAGGTAAYSKIGYLSRAVARSLYFSEPMIKAEEERPFKRICVDAGYYIIRDKGALTGYHVQVESETETEIFGFTAHAIARMRFLKSDVEVFAVGEQLNEE